MDRWAQIAVVVCLIIMTGLLSVIAYNTVAAEPDHATQALAQELRDRVALIGRMQEFHLRRTGRYAGTFYEIEEVAVSNPTPAWREYRQGTQLHLSTSGRTVLIAAPREAEGPVECAQLLRDENATSYTLIPAASPWTLEPNGDVRCRRRGLPWSLLRWTGLGDVAVERGTLF